MMAVPNIDTKLAALMTYVTSLGAAVLPIWGVDKNGYCLCTKGAHCASPGKHPIARFCPQGVNSASRSADMLREWLRQSPEANWAIRCGEEIPGGGYLGAFDWDPRNGSESSLEEITSRGDALPDTVTASSGGGGGHRLYRFPMPPASRMVGPGLDLQGAGKYIVVSPSRHRSGGVYRWELGAAPGECEVAEAPAWLVEGTAEAQGRPERAGAATAKETVLGVAFTLAGRAGAVMPDGTMLVDCVQSHLHSDNRGKGKDASTVILPPAGGSAFGGYKCLHGHCANLKWEDVRAKLPAEAWAEANRRYPRLGLVPPVVDAEVVGGEAVVVPAGGISGKPVPASLVQQGIDRDTLTDIRARLAFKETKSGHKVISDVVNLNIILTHDPRWKGLLRWDDFSQVLRISRRPPWHPDDAPTDDSDVWQDNHVVCLDLWLRRSWGIELAGERIREVVYLVGRRDSYNPLKDWLGGLVWDGVPRIDTWLTRYLGTEDTPYARSAGRKWLISAVARGLNPGCKVDTIVVLEGAQGRGKSTAIRALMPVQSWFSDTPIPLGDKDSFVAMRGKWVIELAELASLKKADLDKAKAFFSSPVDSYRPPYGREMVSIPRTCVFAGTVNPDVYLSDATGARRFWPVRVGVIDLEGLHTDRDQIWAEAVAVYRDWLARGSPQSECLWWPSYEETALFEAEQAEREVETPYGQTVVEWSRTTGALELVQRKGGLTAKDIAVCAFTMDDKDIDGGVLIKVGIAISKEAGWRKVRKQIDGVRRWVYMPKTMVIV